MGSFTTRSYRAPCACQRLPATAFPSPSTTPPPAARRPTETWLWRSPPVARSFGIGKGLEALIPRATDAPPAEVPVDRVRRNPHQPRNAFDEESLAELAASIAGARAIQPIGARCMA